MAHFYAEVQGSRGPTHRLGGKKVGINAEVKGWNARVTVYRFYDEEKKLDCFRIDFNGKAIVLLEEGGKVERLDV